MQNPIPLAGKVKLPFPITGPIPTTNPNLLVEAIKEAASLIAEAIHANAEATVLLARATAGEFEPGDDPQGEQYLDGTAG